MSEEERSAATETCLARQRMNGLGASPICRISAGSSVVVKRGKRAFLPAGWSVRCLWQVWQQAVL